MISLIGFTAIAANVVTKGEITVFDQTTIEQIHEHLLSRLTPIVFDITFFGNAGTVWITTILMAVILFALSKKRECFFMIFATAGSAILMNIVKEYFHRLRPELLNPLLIEPGFSFPSGHALVSTCLYGTLACLIWKLKWPLAARASLCALLVIFIILVGLSRVYLGVHYPSDVLAGFLLGSAWLSTCLIIYQQY